MGPLLFLAFAVFTCLNAHAQGSFVEMSQQAGIEHYQKSNLHLGGGVAVFDLDNDGWEDIYLTGGENRDHLYRNNGDGTFTEMGIDAGFGLTAAVTTHGVVTGDIDNDGFRDILILTELGSQNMLYRNNGNGTFTRLVTALGVSTPERSVSATMGDVNKDGFLDIYITNYVAVNGLIFDENEEIVGFSHECQADRLFINNGDLTFSESSMQYGIVQGGCGLAAAFTDHDGDGNMDILVVNDFGQWIAPNALYHNQLPNSAFDDLSGQLGIDDGFYGMGLAIGDYDRDGDLDYYMTNIGRNYLYRNDGGFFTELAEQAGVLNDSVNGLNTTGWSCFFFDHDNNGRLDLFVANGEIPAAQFIANALEDPDKLFMNNGDGTFTDISDAVGIGSTQRSRGAAFGDFDNDGKQDLVVHSVKHNEAEPVNARLYMNTTDNGNHFLRVKVQGTTSNRDGFGSRVRIVVNGQSQMAEVTGGSGHASHSSSIVHFGLGASTLVDSVIVIFPSGIRVFETNVDADQMRTLTEDLLTGAEVAIDGAWVRRTGERDFLVSSEDRPIEIRIFDSLGRMLHQATNRAALFHIPDHLSGMMIMELSSSKKVFRQKVMVTSAIHCTSNR
ncbi:MAG: CRTAC1 family protein [Flavobacteriales bacterium]|nr:CRTAC1 family protein [Flavobacteriales bacterium]